MEKALNLLKYFCEYTFNKPNVDKALSVLSDNIYWYGETVKSDIHNIHQARLYMQENALYASAPYTAEFINEHETATGERSSIADISIRISKPGFATVMRISAAASVENGKSKLIQIHMSLYDKAQINGDLSILPEENSVQENLEDDVADCIIGSYADKNLPICFVSNEMLKRLGYTNSSEFSHDINGLMINSIHPEDRENAVNEINRQIGENDEYTVKFRIRKKDGSYLSSLNTGKKAVTENGSGIIISTCRISDEYEEKSDLLNQLISSMNGGVAIFKVEQENVSPCYISKGVSAILGMSVNEYNSLYADNIAASIYEEDRPMMLQAVKTALNNNQVTSITYRSPHKTNGYVWVNGVFSRYNALENPSYLRAIFTPASQQFENQMLILDSTSTGICIIDKYTYELYYCNKSAFSVLGTKPCNFTGKHCYEVLCGLDAPCSFCKLFDAATRNKPQEIYSPKMKRTYYITGKESKWNGKSVIIEYLSDITRSKEVEEKLQQSRIITEAASSFAGIWLWTYDLQANTAYYYEKLRNDFSLPEELEVNPASGSAISFVLPEYRSKFHYALQQLKNNIKTVSFDCKVYYTDKSEHWVRCLFNIISYEGKKPKLAVCTSQPIDTEKALEARVILEQQKPFVNQKSLLGYVITNLTRDTVISHHAMHANAPKAVEGTTLEKATEDFAKYIPDDEVRKKYIAMHSPKRLLEFYEQGGTSDDIEFRMKVDDGSTLWRKNTIDILRDPSTGDILIYEYCYDIDAEKKAQIALESLMQEEIDYVSIVNIRTGLGSLIHANNKIITDTVWQNFSYSSVIEKLVLKRVAEEDKKRVMEFFSLESIKKALSSRPITSITYGHRQEDGKIMRKKTRVFYLDDTHNDLILARRDITDLYEEEQQHKKVLEKAVAAANAASRAKSNFLAQMSHEIRTPMNAIIGMTKLAEDVASSSETLEYLKKIDASSNYLLGILNDVLDMSRIENEKLVLHPEWISASELISSCINMQIPTAEAKNINFVYPSTAEISNYEYFADPLRTKQILMNLLNNAFKFTQDGGTVIVSVRCIFLTDDESTEEICVSDTGCGMSEEFLKRIFKPFEQEHNMFSDIVQGTGLGLALVKNIITAMGGTITVKSELGKGSTFTVTCTNKYRLSTDKVIASTHTNNVIDFTGKRILLTDDHPLNREIAKKLLEKKNAQIELATNGKEAADLFAASPLFYYDALLMDIRMPVMDGLEATRTIRAMDRKDTALVPIIAMTANAFDEDAQTSKAAGMNAHLPKPINPSVLYHTIADLIDRNDSGTN